MDEYIISVKGLNKQINKKSILKDVSFSIKKGQITGLLGPNGSGKTTMIRLLNGVIDESSGEIQVLGKTPKEDGAYIRSQSGIVTESTNLYHEMTAWDNLMFFSTLYGIDDKERAKQLLIDFEMWEHRDELIGSFSTGMKKRVSLAKALLHRPQLLFLDEPTNGLDPEGIQMVLGYLKKLNQREKITIVICSHVLHQLEDICDAFVFIKNGELIESGTRRELEEKYLKEVIVRVETGAEPSKGTYNGFVYEKVDEHVLQFHLSSKNDITPLLKQLTSESWVHGCEIVNRHLDALYFEIGGDKHE